MRVPNRDILIGSAVSGLIGLSSAVLLVVTGAPPPDPHEAAGVFPPWWSRGRVFAAAGEAGAVRDLGAVPFIVVVRDPEGRAPQRLRRAGALFSVSPAGTAACLN
ncbi:MAG: hypothetical protein GC203_10755 [Phenylobacterium sp.]|uniref:hypothetical protein n=1 Tax=Phenylobacterium sp. TaxID=1871053 RepID=UPI0025F11BD7|nr:hypothetical protein [Phenylobacterium sp.]MBI1198331.1 hypothetical protein [Phenylobacterium sp.]